MTITIIIIILLVKHILKTIIIKQQIVITIKTINTNKQHIMQ